MTHLSRRIRSTPARGFSIIELLIAIIIIGILVSILIPVIANRSEDARLARAHTDLENLASAQERLVIDTGYMARLYVLNDVVGGDGIAFTRPQDPNDYIDGIRDHGVGTEYYQRPRYLFVDIETGEVADGAIGDQLYFSVTRNETAFGWRGPYINWHRDNNTVDAITGPDGIPDDPWGNNYLLFTREGLVQEPEGVVNNEAQYKRFDRATILSLGPNGVAGNGPAAAPPDNQYGAGDDIVRKFGQ